MYIDYVDDGAVRSCLTYFFDASSKNITVFHGDAAQDIALGVGSMPLQI